MSCVRQGRSFILKTFSHDNPQKSRMSSFPLSDNQRASQCRDLACLFGGEESLCLDLLGEPKGRRALGVDLDLAGRQRQALEHADVADALLPPLAHEVVDLEAPAGPDVLDAVLGVDADEALPARDVVNAVGVEGVEAELGHRRVVVVRVLDQVLAGRGPELRAHVHLAVRLEHGQPAQLHVRLLAVVERGRGVMSVWQRRCSVVSG